MSIDGLFQQHHKSVPDSKRHKEGKPSQSRKAPSVRKFIFLHDWWLVKADPDPHGKQLGIGGFTLKDNQGMRCFSSASISKRDDAVTLQTVDGIKVTVQGYLNRSRTLENGFSKEVCDHFLIGFPYDWEEYAALSVNEEPDNSSASKEVSPSDAYKTPVQEARTDLAGGGNSSASKEVSPSDAYKTQVQEARTDLACGGNSSSSKDVSPSDAYKTPVQEALTDLAGGGNSSASKEFSPSDAYKTQVQEARTDLAGGGNSSASKDVSPSDAYKTPVQEALTDLAGGGNSSASKDVSPSNAYKTRVKESRMDLAGGPLTRSRARLLVTRR